jgi:hypothetical protein
VAGVPDLHSAVAALAPLLGNWSGRGSGEYPTIAPFDYIDEGTVTTGDGGLAIEVRSTAVGLTTSAKEVVALERSIRVDGDELHYTVRMGAVGQPLQHHLTATLHRQP